MRKSIDGYRRVSAVDRFRFPPAHGGHARGTARITRGPIFGDRYSSELSPFVVRRLGLQS